MPSPRALVTGITGQDGSYLAEFLLEKGYRVYGLQRRLSTPNTSNLRGIEHHIHLIQGDLLDLGSLLRALEQSEADEVYNLAAQSFVGASWDQPLLTGAVTGLGAAHLLEAIRQVRPRARLYQASSSEMFGNAPHSPQSESTPFAPRSPYGAAKAYAHLLAVNYRESHGLHCCCGILFNHESPRRGVEFVTRKIARSAVRVRLGIDQEVNVGDISARRDWGFAPEYVEAMWRMLQLDAPSDYVVATGEDHSVEDWLDAAFDAVGLDWRPYARRDPALVRPAEIGRLIGDASRAARDLGWQPKTGFSDLVRKMVDAELEAHTGRRQAAG